MRYKTLLNTLHTAILNNSLKEAKECVVPQQGFSEEAQLQVYSHGYRIRLQKVVRAEYPALEYCIGLQAMNQWVREFVEKTPSTHFNIDRYAHIFPDFIEGAVEPFAHQLAILEASIARVFLLPDSVPLDRKNFTARSPEQFAAKPLPLRFAAELLAFDYPVNHYLTVFRENGAPSIPKEEKTYTLVYRHNNHVQRRNLTVEQYTLLFHLVQNKLVEKALTTTIETHPDSAEHIISQLQSWFHEWVSDGVFRREAES